MKKLYSHTLQLVKDSRIIYPVVALFFLCKLFHLFIPYYWDELGVYTQAALYMHDHGITLLPGIMPPELSRGHPLVCAAVFGSMYKLLGPHVWVGHLAAILISSLLLIVFYKLCREVLKPTFALLSCIVLMLQPVFIAQSGMVLPEMLLALFCTAALLFYVRREYIRLAFFLTLAIMTKETAIALPAAILIIEAFVLLFSRTLQNVNLKMILSSICPLLIWGAFLVGQKIQNGWFFFPLHSDYVSFSISQIISRSCYYISFLLKGQGRYLWTVLSVSSILLCVYHYRRSLCADLWRLIREHLINRTPWVLFCSFAAMALAVSSLNFHLARYTLFFLPVICVLVVGLSSILFKSTGQFTPAVLTLALLALPLFHYEANHFTFDADMGYRHVVSTQKDAIQFIDHNFAEQSVIMSDFPMSTALAHPRGGYTVKRYDHIVQGCGKEDTRSADLYIYTNPGNLESCHPKTKHLALVREFKSSFANVLIYTDNP